jgi:acetyl esterase/lipase
MAAPFPPFDPQWLATEQMMGGRQTLPAEPVDQARDRFRGIFGAVAPFIPPPTDAVRTEDVQISPTQRIRIYTPANAEGREPGKIPVGLYIHSGGWYGGSVELEDHLARIICEQAKVMLFSPDYRLAPENPYPAGLDDVCTAYEWMHHNAAKYCGDPAKKAIMGGSAGGNLTACVAVKYASQGDLAPVGVIAAVLASCDPAVMPDEYKKRYTPELYADAPLVGNEIVAQARSKFTHKHIHVPLSLHSPSLIVSPSRTP